MLNVKTKINLKALMLVFLFSFVSQNSFAAARHVIHFKNNTAQALEIRMTGFVGTSLSPPVNGVIQQEIVQLPAGTSRQYSVWDWHKYNNNTCRSTYSANIQARLASPTSGWHKLASWHRNCRIENSGGMSLLGNGNPRRRWSSSIQLKAEHNIPGIVLTCRNESNCSFGVRAQ